MVLPLLLSLPLVAAFLVDYRRCRLSTDDTERWWRWWRMWGLGLVTFPLLYWALIATGHGPRGEVHEAQAIVPTPIGVAFPSRMVEADPPGTGVARKAFVLGLGLLLLSTWKLGQWRAQQLGAPPRSSVPK